jgi:amidohydrolase
LNQNIVSLKDVLCKVVDQRQDEICDIGSELWKSAELGFKEFKTASTVAKEFKRLGLEPEEKVAITGVIAELVGRATGPTIAVIGELDALVCYDHPDADPSTGAVHACGHNAQLAGMLGAAAGLAESGVMKELPGKVVFMAVPAEEYVEIEYRLSLRRKGEIVFLGGKQEFIRLERFDDVDLAITDHSRAEMPERKAEVGGSLYGFIGKMIQYRGRESHAGGRPERGVNALNAALLGLMGIHAQRDTFKDDDHIRVHPIITKGGEMVNIVPADVRMETYVRGRTMAAIVDANVKVNRALKAGADALGATVTVEDVPGYLPTVFDSTMNTLLFDNLATIIGRDNVALETEHRTGSSDIGDVSCIIPTTSANVGGVSGGGHSKDFRIVDPYMEYVVPAKAMAMTVLDLLADEASRAKSIMSQFKPMVPKKEYAEQWKKIMGGK